MDDLPEDLTQVDPDELVGVGLTGIDHLYDHLSVQEFSVDGASGAQAGDGARQVCCVKLPRVWHPGLTVEVRWNVTNWRDCTGQDLVNRVPVERYDQLGQMWVHFLPNGVVRVAQTRKPKIKRIVFDVFGFSRGAAEARVFCNWLGELMPDGKLCGVPAEIRFLGLFDTVASVGGSALLGSEGHGDWASAANLRIGPHVKRCVHYVAMHEQRASFPVDTVRNPDGSVPKNCQQWMFPGMHSDVGGGYTPEEQGRGPDRRNSQKLSQIPLNRMYEAARQAGVPLDKSLAQTVSVNGKYDPFEIDPSVQQAFDAFMAASAGSARRLRDWLKPYLIWRYQQRHHYLDLPWSRRSPAEDVSLLTEANKGLLRDLEILESPLPMPGRLDAAALQPAPTGAGRDGGGVTGSMPQAQKFLSSESREIFELMRAAGPVPPALATLFADYVHDSYAGFSVPGVGHEYTGYLHYRRQYMGSDKPLAQQMPDDDRDRQYA